MQKIVRVLSVVFLCALAFGLLTAWSDSDSSQAALSHDAVLNSFYAEHGSQWNVRLESQQRFVRRMWGSGIGVNLMPDASACDAADACRKLMERWGGLWGVEGVELGSPTVHRALDLWFINFPQTIEGRPVLGAGIFFRVHTSGSVVLIGSDLIPGLTLEGGEAFGMHQALAVAEDESGVSLDGAEMTLVAWPDRGSSTASWAWRIEARPGTRHLRPLYYIDAADLGVLGRRDLMNHAAVSGTVTGEVHPLYETDPLSSVALGEMRVMVTDHGFDITDSAGDYSVEAGTGSVTVWAELDGPFLDVHDYGMADSKISQSGTAGGTVDFEWSNSNSTAAERDVFYHLGMAREFMKDLDSEFTALDSVLGASANGPGSCDASWDGAAFLFSQAGGSCGNMGSFADVVYHEYGHAVTEKMGEVTDAFPAELHEAFSDYFACTITDDPEFGEWVYGTADPIRDIDLPDLVTPDDLTGDAEHDSMILSGALWDMRQNLIGELGPVAGQTLADDLFHFARYGLAETFEDYFLDLWALDDDNGDLSDGTPHAYYIVEAFNRHGMGPEVGIDVAGVEITGDDNSNGTAEPGETLELIPTVNSRYKGTDSLELTLLSDSQYVTILEPTVSFPYVEQWSEATAYEGWEVEIDPDTPFGEQVAFDISIIADEGDYTETESWALTVGAFQILLVDDDGGQEIEVYLTNALIGSGYTFAMWNVSGVEQSPRMSDLSPYPVVIWNTADQQENTLTEPDQEALADYMDAGGSLLLIGQDILNDIGLDTFAFTYLHLTGMEADQGATLLFPPENEPVSEGMFFDSLIPIYADRADGLTLGENAAPVLLNQLSSPVLMRFPQVGAADYRMMFMSFSYESLPIEGTEPSTGPTLLNRCLDWLLPMQIIAIDPENGEGDVPVNADVVIGFSKPVDTSTFELVVYPDVGEFTMQWSAMNDEVTLSHAAAFPANGEEMSFQVVTADDIMGNSLVRGDIPNPFKFTTAGPPVPAEIVPDHGVPDEPVEILVKGAAFLDTPTLALGDTMLEQVTYRSDDILSAVVPAGMEEGVYDLKVVNPDTQEGILEGAYEVGEPEPDEGDDDDDDDSGCGCSTLGANSNSAGNILIVLAALFLAACAGNRRANYRRSR